MLKPRLVSLDPDIWSHEHPLRVMGLFRLGHRMTVVRLADGGLIVHSPTPLDRPLADELGALGPVRYVLAPSLMHNLFLPPWAEHFPDAIFLAAPGFAERYPKLRVDGVLEDKAWPGDELRTATLAGMPRVHETVVLHAPTRTLVVADLVFNFGRRVPLATALLLRAVGAREGVRASRLFRSLIRDRAAFRGSLEHVLGWNFERLVPGHGRVLEHGARDALRAAWTAYLE